MLNELLDAFGYAADALDKPPTDAGIYQIRNIINGKIYLGSAVNLRERWRTHRRELRHDRHKSIKLQAAWNKHGAEQFAFEILEIVADRIDLIGREQDWLDRLAPYRKGRGYNHCQVAASMLGHRHSEEAKSKMRGRVFSADHRAKLSAARKSYKHSRETIEKARAANTGRRRDPSASEKAAAKMRGRARSKEHIAKSSAGLTGRKLSVEHRAKISAFQKGRVHSVEQTVNRLAAIRSPEVRVKMSAAQKVRWARVREEAREIKEADR